MTVLFFSGVSGRLHVDDRGHVRPPQRLAAGRRDRRAAAFQIPAADCETCETKEGKLDRIDRQLQFAGPLTEEQRARLIEIANKCPVHRTLTSEINIRTHDG